MKKKWKKKNCTKKKWYRQYLSYMCKSNWGRSLPGVENKPKKELRGPIQEQENYIVIKLSMWQYINESLIR